MFLFIFKLNIFVLFYGTARKLLINLPHLQKKKFLHRKYWLNVLLILKIVFSFFFNGENNSFNAVNKLALKDK